jgi:hypothetical protein
MQEEITTVDDVVNAIGQDADAGPEMGQVPGEYPTRRGHLKMKCSCGRVSNISEDVIEDGLSFTMIVGAENYITLHCDECDSEITMFIEEILEDNELPQESNKE